MLMLRVAAFLAVGHIPSPYVEFPLRGGGSQGRGKTGRYVQHSGHRPMHCDESARSMRRAARAVKGRAARLLIRSHYVTMEKHGRTKARSPVETSKPPFSYLK